MKKCFLLLLLFLLFFSIHAQDSLKLIYSHPNSPQSIAGQQAVIFADKVEELTDGSIAIEIYPSSQLGSLQEMAEQVSIGLVTFHHNTAAAIGTLFEDIPVLDTPFLYDDIDHLLRVADMSSAIMQQLNERMIESRGVRILYTFYFGTRHLTLDRPAYSPDDLKDVKIRAIPFPIYQSAVEGLGGTAVPIDWAEAPAALEAGVINGQENPVNIILNAELNNSQDYLILTGHIKAADIMVMNNDVWLSLTPEQQDILEEAGEYTSKKATQLALDLESSDLKALQNLGMTVISEDDGLDLAAFRENTWKIIFREYYQKWIEYYRMIDELSEE